jgi:hypothetical protein
LKPRRRRRRRCSHRPIISLFSTGPCRLGWVVVASRPAGQGWMYGTVCVRLGQHIKRQTQTQQSQETHSHSSTSTLSVILHYAAAAAAAAHAAYIICIERGASSSSPSPSSSSRVPRNSPLTRQVQLDRATRVSACITASRGAIQAMQKHGSEPATRPNSACPATCVRELRALASLALSLMFPRLRTELACDPRRLHYGPYSLWAIHPTVRTTCVNATRHVCSGRRGLGDMGSFEDRAVAELLLSGTAAAAAPAPVLTMGKSGCSKTNQRRGKGGPRPPGRRIAGRSGCSQDVVRDSGSRWPPLACIRPSRPPELSIPRGTALEWCLACLL